ncbi:LysE family translocator [Herbaspirillum rhizosphaerae]|uniref:LysE family translocator n=1 Tax=Herbaspirillum rhizosphaerae TaxID=346179 RepID=UPI00067C8012|nr:LysE family translocator [Herbaspirillum rhizosphaerae]
MTLQTFFLYLAAVFVLTVTPGPSVLMCITNGIHHGVRRAFAGALGSVTAVCLIMIVSASGLGVILAVSEKVFLILKWCGVAYLAYIGVRTFFSTQSTIGVDDGQAPATAKSRASLYWQGFLVGGSNPKALLFFTAFFPQFINPQAAQLPQFLILGATFVCFELFWLTFYAHFAARVAPWLRTPGRAKMFNRLSGATFIGAGALLATVKRS